MPSGNEIIRTQLYKGSCIKAINNAPRFSSLDAIDMSPLKRLECAYVLDDENALPEPVNIPLCVSKSTSLVLNYV